MDSNTPRESLSLVEQLSRRQGNKYDEDGESYEEFNESQEDREPARVSIPEPEPEYFQLLRQKDTMVSDGINAYLPSVWMQVPIFSPSQHRTSYDLDVIQEFVLPGQAEGEIIIVNAPRMLYTNPDLVTWLGILALLQKHKFQTLYEFKYFDDEELEDLDIFMDQYNKGIVSSFLMSDLYSLLGADKKGKGQAIIRDSIEVLKRTSIQIIRDGDTLTTQQLNREKRKNTRKFDKDKLEKQEDMTNLLGERQYYKMQGRCKQLTCIGIPPKYERTRNSQYINVQGLAKIKHPTARAIYWYFSGRQHKKLTLHEWYKTLTFKEPSNRRLLYKWKANQLAPAQKELEVIGFDFKWKQKDLIIKRPW